MRAFLTIAALALVASPALAGEEPVRVTLTVKGMSCPDGCAPLISKELGKVKGVGIVKLVDFKKGLFTLSWDRSRKLSPLELQDAVGVAYPIARIEVTLTGTVTKNEKGVSIRTADGARYSLKSCCSDGEKQASPVLTRVAELLDGGRSVLRVTGDLDEACGGKVVLAARKAEPVTQ